MIMIMIIIVIIIEVLGTEIQPILNSKQQFKLLCFIGHQQMEQMQCFVDRQYSVVYWILS